MLVAFRTLKMTEVAAHFNFTSKLKLQSAHTATEVPAQINFKIKLNNARECQRLAVHEGLPQSFNFGVKLNCAATSVNGMVAGLQWESASRPSRRRAPETWQKASRGAGAYIRLKHLPDLKRSRVNFLMLVRQTRAVQTGISFFTANL